MNSTSTPPCRWYHVRLRTLLFIAGVVGGPLFWLGYWLEKRRFQFSVGTLLFLMLVVGAVCSWWMRPRRIQQQIAGGMFTIDAEVRYALDDNGIMQPIRHGRWVLRDAAGRRWVEGHYRDGEPHGRWRHFYPTREVKLTGTAQDGFRHDTWSLLGIDGSRLASAQFVPREVTPESSKKTLAMALREGAATWTGVDSPITARGSFQADRRSGQWKLADHIGAPLAEGECDQGQRRGRWQVWLDAESAPMTVEYSEGIAVRADEVLLDELADRLAGGTRSQRIRAVQRMRHCGQSGARILGATLDTKDADVLVIALGALRSMGTTAAAQSEAVDGLSDHPNATIRCRALLALTQLKPENRSVYIRRVFELGADGSPAERRAIHRQLSTLGAAAVDAAESRLQSDDIATRRAAVDVLGQVLYSEDHFGNGKAQLVQRVVELLRRAAEDEAEEVRSAATAWLDGIPRLHWRDSRRRLSVAVRTANLGPGPGSKPRL